MLFEQAVYLYVIDKTEGRKPVRPNTLEGYLSAIRCHLNVAFDGTIGSPRTTGTVWASITYIATH